MLWQPCERLNSKNETQKLKLENCNSKNETLKAKLGKVKLKNETEEKPRKTNLAITKLKIKVSKKETRKMKGKI